MPLKDSDFFVNYSTILNAYLQVLYGAGVLWLYEDIKAREDKIKVDGSILQE